MGSWVIAEDGSVRIKATQPAVYPGDLASAGVSWIRTDQGYKPSRRRDSSDCLSRLPSATK